jgi:hypothetical protein
MFSEIEQIIDNDNLVPVFDGMCRRLLLDDGRSLISLQMWMLLSTCASTSHEFVGIIARY